MDLSVVLLHIVSAGLVLGLAGALLVQRPARTLAGPLWAFLILSMLYIVGDALTQLSEGLEASLFWEELGIALLYTGAIGGAATCWVVPIRFAELHLCRPAWLGASWVRIPLALSAAAWLVMITNPWHGQFIVPVVGALNSYTPLWYPLVYLGYAQVIGAVLLFGWLVHTGPDLRVRRNAALMAGGVSLLMLSNFFYYELVRTSHGDLTVLGLGVASLFFLYGSYRTRIFSLLPMGLVETQHHDPEALVIASQEGRLLHANPAGLGILGSDDEGSDPDVFERLADRLRETDGSELDGVALKKRLSDHRLGMEGLSMRLTDGERFFRAQMTPIPSRSGEIMALLLRFVDITELRRIRDALERKVAERTAQLRASEERYRTVSELSSDGGFSIRVFPDGSIEGEWVTPAMTRLTGLAVEDVVGRPWETGVHPADREAVGRALTRPDETPGPIEFRMLRSRPEPHWLELDVSVARRWSDGSLRVVGAVRDVHERRKADAERRRFERRAQEAQRLESLGALAGGIAHDFNNAMSIVLGNAQLARERAGRGTLLRKPLDRIQAAAKHASDLTDQLLTYAGKSAPQFEALHLGTLLKEMEQLLTVSASGSNPLRIEPCAEPLFAEGDATQIRQVVMNLVRNAREAYGEASGPVTIRTGHGNPSREELAAAEASWAEAGRGYVWLEVSDQASGISEDVRRRIFDPFATTKFLGRGLGLSVVLAIVRSHAGAIFVDSHAGQGTRFRVLLPAAEAPVATSPKPRAERKRLPRGATVLVVDDDEAVLELARIFLEQAGFRVRTVPSGQEALDLVLERSEALDAIVLDLAMPGMDGREVMDALRLERPELPVIVTSGFDEKRVEQRLGEGSPASPFLAKPYEPEALVEQVRKAIETAARSPLLP